LSAPNSGFKPLNYSVHFYQTAASSIKNLETSNNNSLRELILKKKPALLSAFEAADTENVGFVSRTKWSEIMQEVTNIKIRWLSILATIATKDCTSPTSVNYVKFLQAYSVANHAALGRVAHGDEGADGKRSSQSEIVDQMYGQRRKLERCAAALLANQHNIITPSLHHHITTSLFPLPSSLIPLPIPSPLPLPIP
jgi:hypothetical protein